MNESSLNFTNVDSEEFKDLIGGISGGSVAIVLIAVTVKLIYKFCFKKTNEETTEHVESQKEIPPSTTTVIGEIKHDSKIENNIGKILNRTMENMIVYNIDENIFKKLTRKNVKLPTIKSDSSDSKKSMEEAKEKHNKKMKKMTNKEIQEVKQNNENIILVDSIDKFCIKK